MSMSMGFGQTLEANLSNLRVFVGGEVELLQDMDKGQPTVKLELSEEQVGPPWANFRVDRLPGHDL